MFDIDLVMDYIRSWTRVITGYYFWKSIFNITWWKHIIENYLLTWESWTSLFLFECLWQLLSDREKVSWPRAAGQPGQSSLQTSTDYTLIRKWEGVTEFTPVWKEEKYFESTRGLWWASVLQILRWIPLLIAADKEICILIVPTQARLGKSLTASHRPH